MSKNLFLGNPCILLIFLLRKMPFFFNYFAVREVSCFRTFEKKKKTRGAVYQKFLLAVQRKTTII